MGSRQEHENTRDAGKHITIPNDKANTNRLNDKGGGVTDANNNRYKYNKTTINRTYRTGQARGAQLHDTQQAEMSANVS